MSRWQLEHSPSRDSVWFVCARRIAVRAILPPAAALVRTEISSGGAADADGWRMALWRPRGDQWPQIDIEPPDQVSALSTREVLHVLPRQMHEQVRRVLCEQLQVVRSCLGTAPARLCGEEAARACSGAELWLTDEIAAGFGADAVPPRAEEPLLAAALRLSREPRLMPETGDQLLALIDRQPASTPAAGPTSVRRRLKNCLRKLSPEAYDAVKVVKNKLRDERGAPLSQPVEERELFEQRELTNCL